MVQVDCPDNCIRKGLCKYEANIDDINRELATLGADVLPDTIHLVRCKYLKTVIDLNPFDDKVRETVSILLNKDD